VFNPARCSRFKFKTKLLLIILLYVLSLTGCSGGSGSSSTDSDDEPSLLVGAHYYFWFPENFKHGFLREKLVPAQEPLLGRYSSDSTAVAERHIEWAASAGIDFFTLDYWPSRPSQNARINSFLRAANLSKIKFAIFYETWDLNFDAARAATDFDQETSSKFVSELVRLGESYFDHPAYLKVNGRPVLFLYLTRTAVGDFLGAIQQLRQELLERGLNVLLIGDEIFWRVTTEGPAGPGLTTDPQPQRSSLFDAIFSYNLYESENPLHAGYAASSQFIPDVNQLYRTYRAATDNKIPILPTVIPGYNDRGVRRSLNHYVIPRRLSAELPEGSFFSAQWDQIVETNLDSRLPIALITSWNEWNEDTAIEPLTPAANTSKDRSTSGNAYTSGFEYSGYDTTYLNFLAEKKLQRRRRQALRVERAN
jgi:glycoprotein endo-alpha-1,2-mannosidase